MLLKCLSLEEIKRMLEKDRLYNACICDKIE